MSSVFSDYRGSKFKKLSAPAMLFFLLSLSIFSVNQAIAEQTEWKSSKEKDGIKTFSRKIAGSKYKAIRGETTLAIPVAKLVAVINDAKACVEWADLCKKSVVKKQVSNTEAYVYTLNDMPWPVKDREVTAHLNWSKNEQGSVTMISQAVIEIPSEDSNKNVEKTKGVVRIETANARWDFTPLGDNKTLTQFEIHMDPNGKIPGWLLNRLVLDSPFTTFKSLATQASKEKYNNATLPF